jgi:hypothetical protein
MKLRILLAAMCLFPLASTAQVVPAAELDRHAVEPLLRVYGDIEFGGFRYIPTNAGLYVVDVNGAPVKHHALNDTFQNTDLATFAKREADLLFFSIGSRPSCFPQIDYASRGITVYRVEGSELSAITTLPEPGYPSAYVDPFDQIWINIYPTGNETFSRVFVMQGDDFPEAPLFTQVDVMRIHQPTGQVVVRQFMTSGPFAGIQFVTHNGEEFVPYTGPQQELVGMPWSPERNDLIPDLQEDFGWRPEMGSILDLQEATDGSLWYLDAKLNVICLTKSTAEVETTAINEFSRQIFESKIRRRIDGATETHATWIQDTFGSYAWIHAVSMSESGDPILSIQRTFSEGFSYPQAWWYSANPNRLVYWEDPPSSWPPNYDVLVVGEVAIFAGATNVVIVRDGHPWKMNFLPEWGTFLNETRIQRIDTDRVRLYSRKGSYPQQYFSMDVVIEDSGTARFENVIPVGWRDAAWMDVDENGTVWTGTSNGVRGTHPVNAPINVEFDWMRDVSDVMVRSNGEIWVASCEGVAVIDPTGELLVRLDRHNGLSSDCAISVMEGASGNVYIGSAYGYTILGDPDLISGAPLAELTPTSIPKEDPYVDMGVVLHPNYPNPFNPVTEIRWTLNAGRHMRLSISDILGREIAVLVDGVMPAGEHRVSFDAGGLASGVYVMRLQAGDQVLTRKMVLVK